MPMTMTVFYVIKHVTRKTQAWMSNKDSKRVWGLKMHSMSSVTMITLCKIWASSATTHIFNAGDGESYQSLPSVPISVVCNANDNDRFLRHQACLKMHSMSSVTMITLCKIWASSATTHIFIAHPCLCLYTMLVMANHIRVCPVSQLA
jgi:hypothetical protein